MIKNRLSRVISRRETSDDGVAAVEFALVLPIFVALLFTIVVSTSVYIDQLQLQSVARNAARSESVAAASGCAVATQELAPNAMGTVQCIVHQTCSSGMTRIELISTQQVTIPVVGNRTVVLHATSSFVCS